MITDQPARPANILNIVAINQGLRPLTMNEPVVPAVTPAQVQALLQAGGCVIDVRSSKEFGAGHIPGAYNFQIVTGEFEQRIGWVVPPDIPFILVCSEAEDAQTAVHKLAFVGLDQRAQGYITYPEWQKANLPTTILPQLTVNQLHEKLSHNGIQVLDVRETSEWDDGHIASAHYMNFKFLDGRLAELPLKPEQEIAVVCATGQRSSTACSTLLRHGYSKTHNVVGGMTAWRAAGLPMTEKV